MFAAVRLATVLYPSGPSHDPRQKHLFVLLTDPTGPAKQVLMVPICTYDDPTCDGSCLLKEGDHPWIKHGSYVLYALARTERADSLVAGVTGGQFTAKDPISEKIYAKIVQGLKQSDFTKPFAKEFLDQYTREVIRMEAKRK